LWKIDVARRDLAAFGSHMTRITFIEHDGKAHAIEAVNGRSVMQSAVDNRVPGIIGDCGGYCSCATCHGYIDAAWIDKLSPPAGDEAAMLECAIDRQDASRLTCQIDVTPELDGLVVRLPVSQI
jgi:2Fe-2S ferredoxin